MAMSFFAINAFGLFGVMSLAWLTLVGTFGGSFSHQKYRTWHGVFDVRNTCQAVLGT
jgi:hypothetical protein